MTPPTDAASALTQAIESLERGNREFAGQTFTDEQRKVLLAYAGAMRLQFSQPIMRLIADLSGLWPRLSAALDETERIALGSDGGEN